ncbi:hypothetical protein ACER0C_002479 [Sarotherodon galilaeus]
MSAVPASLCFTLLFFGVFVFVSAEPTKIITAVPGQDVTLTCRALNNNIIVVNWSRADLGDKYVLLYQDGQFDPDQQHPSFKNRVELQDRQMKDGDVSLILKHVTINDAGTYECRVVQSVRGPMTLINSTYLIVLPEPTKIITAVPGQDITLTCQAPNNKITAVEWSRADLMTDYVLLYKDDHLDRKHQHSSFENRVDLQDRQMKDGDVSLILKKVTINDAGTYMCRVVQRAGGPVTVINITHLNVVDPPDQPGGYTTWLVRLGWIVLVALGISVVGFCAFGIYKKIKKQPGKLPKKGGTVEPSEAVSETSSDITQRKANKQGQKETDHQTHLLSSQHEPVIEIGH